jgi:outer membrane lipoprotein-sorting protein
MNKIIIIVLGMFLLASQVSAQMDAREIIKKSREVSKIKGMEALSTLKIYDSKGRERVRKTSMASGTFDNGRTEKRIIRFLSPAEVEGTGILIFDNEDESDDMWIYMPALRKTRRIVSSEKGKSFMGSEFSNADMTAPTLDDFIYSILGSEDLSGSECWKIEKLPLNEDISDETGLSKEILWVSKKEYVTLRSEYYDLDEELWKIRISSNVKEITSGKYMASYMKMENIQNGRTSEFTLDQIQYNPQVKEEYFTIRYLEKL